MKKKLFEAKILLILIFLSTGLIPLKAEIKTIPDTIVKVDTDELMFVDYEEMPFFPGGEIALRQYFIDNIVYPGALKDSNLTGTIYVAFTIHEDGSVADPRIFKSLNPLLDEEVIRLVEAMPDWIPGKQRGRAVVVQQFLPLKFPLMPIETEDF